MQRSHFSPSASLPRTYLPYFPLFFRSAVAPSLTATTNTSLFVSRTTSNNLTMGLTMTGTMIFVMAAILSPMAESFAPSSISSMVVPRVSSRAFVRSSGASESLMARRMVAGGAQAYGEEMYDGVRIGPPPDLPSLLLHNRIVYIGMPLVPAVTELVIAELLYLNYEDTQKPITMYINSSGTTTPDGRSVGFETEAFAIADVMKYVRPPVCTVAVGQAFGAAAMLLAQGKRGKRFSLPNATILLNQPRSMARGQATDIAIKAREVAHNRRKTCELLATACGKPLKTVEEDCQRVKYLQPHEAVSYGLIDKVMVNESTLPVKPSFISQL